MIGAALDAMRGRWWIIALAAALLWGGIQFSNARHWEKRYLQQVALIEAAKREAAEQRAANEKRVADAVSEYASRQAAAQPIIIRSREEVTRYAQTAQGRSACLPADRVDSVRRDREALFPGETAEPASNGAGAVPTVPAP